MSDFVPGPPGNEHAGPEPTTLLDRRATEAWAEHRWSVRAAQWRAVELAGAIFGPGVRGELAGGVLQGPFRALLHLEVPFRDLDAHRAGESLFVAMAGADPVLSQVPFVYVFAALAPEAPRTSPRP